MSVTCPVWGLNCDDVVSINQNNHAVVLNQRVNSNELTYQCHGFLLLRLVFVLG